VSLLSFGEAARDLRIPPCLGPNSLLLIFPTSFMAANYWKVGIDCKHKFPKKTQLPGRTRVAYALSFRAVRSSYAESSLMRYDHLPTELDV
jgi:hypothetical protein